MKTKDDRINEQISLNTEFVQNENLNMDFLEAELAIKKTKLETIFEELDVIMPDEEVNVQILRMLNNAINYIITGQTKWTNESIEAITKNKAIKNCESCGKIIKSSIGEQDFLE